MQDDVSVDEQEHGTRREIRSAISGRRSAPSPIEPDQGRSKLFRDRFHIVDRTVVDDDELVAGSKLRRNGAEAALERSTAVVRRDNDAQERTTELGH
jgi:hypothetical protein